MLPTAIAATETPLPTRMRAAVYDRYGPPEVVSVEEVARPEPKAGEVLIRIRATTVTSGDRRARSMDVPAGFGLLSRLVFGIARPRQPILGSDLAGDVVAVGEGVRAFAVGDAVIASSDAKLGCHAEYRTMKEDGTLVKKPADLTYEEAAALPFGGTTALHFLRKAGLERGERILVNGASGAVGTACVQLARWFGAEVTGVTSTANLELVRTLGASHVIDYTREDFTQNEQTYDVIVDTVGTAPWARSAASLTERGRLLLVEASLPEMLRAIWGSMTSRRRVVAGVALAKAEDLRFLAERAVAGELRAVIDRTYPLDRIAEAHRYADTGRKRGSVVITLSCGQKTRARRTSFTASPTK